MKENQSRLRALLSNPSVFLKWVVFALITGVAAGLAGTAFHYALHGVTVLQESRRWLLLLLPAVGVAIVGLYRLCGVEKDRGTNFVLTSVRENTALPLNMAPLIFLSTVLTHLEGGSSGREGAVLQIGGAISNRLGRLMRLDDKDRRVITMCGMSAAFSALFGTPLTAAMFAMEVVSVGVMYYAAIVPCVRRGPHGL